MANGIVKRTTRQILLPASTLGGPEDMSIVQEKRAMVKHENLTDKLAMLQRTLVARYALLYRRIRQTQRNVMFRVTSMVHGNAGQL